jgi:hypothetical protein
MILGISGKKGSGKDTVGKIIQYFTSIDPDFHRTLLLDTDNNYQSTFQIQKFASTLKDWICQLTNCTREQLENEDFKNQELGEEWWYYTVQKKHSSERLIVAYDSTNPMSKYGEPSTLIKPTRRNLLETIGTDCGRMVVHPNVWVNDLMGKYVSKKYSIGIDKVGYQTIVDKYPNWIITDVRFPNELKAIKDKGGIIIRVNRDNGTKAIDVNPHVSETSLDNATFDYVIDNSGSIDELVDKVVEVIYHAGIMKQKEH